GCRQEALTISLAREHAATPRRNTGGEDEKGKKQDAAQRTKGTNDKREKHRQGPHPGRQLHTSPHTLTHHRSAVSTQVRGFGSPHKKRTQRQQSPTMHEEKGPTVTASSSIPRPT
ncbi:exo-alpha-sialidase, partial [Trypanosoma cruzi]